MDELEKKIIQLHGTKIISAEECNKILKQAANNGLIEKKQIRTTGDMSTSELIEYISGLRREFLISDGFNMAMDEEVYDMSTSCEIKQKGKVFESVLKAFIEYEKSRTRRERSYKWMCIVIPVILSFIMLILYTPKPY